MSDTTVSPEPRLRRRHEEILVDEISLVEDGAVGEEADVVVLLKSDEEDEAGDATDGTALPLEKESPVEGEAAQEATPVEDLFAELSSRTGEFTAELKKSLVDLALETAGADTVTAASEKDALTESVEEMLTLLKSFVQHNVVQAKVNEGEPAAETPAEPEAATEPEPVVEPAAEAVEPDPLEEAEKILLEKEREREANAQSQQHTELMASLASLSSQLDGLVGAFDDTRKDFDRACGKDA